MKTCATCQHFHQRGGLRTDARGGDFTGECRATAPVRDFAWHRTKKEDYCALHSDNAPHFASGLSGATSLAAHPAAATPTTDPAPTMMHHRKRSRPARGELFSP